MGYRYRSTPGAIIVRQTGVRERGPGGLFTVVRLTTVGCKTGSGHGLPSPAFAERRILLRDHVSRRTGDRRDQWIGIHSNGIHTYPMECIRHGMDWYPMQWIQLHTIGYQSTAGRRPG